jgi:hypothetical protein
MKILRNVERKEKLEKQKEFSYSLISKKVNNSEKGFENIKLIYPANSNRTAEYTYEEDQFLVYLTFQYGYGKHYANLF